MIQHIIFDFDNTLFDTEKRKTHFYRMAEIHGYSREEAKAIYKKARLDGDRIAISLASFMRALRERVIADGKEFLAEAVSNIIAQMDKGTYLVPYAKQLLTCVSKKQIDRHLLSLGVRAWQEEKMRIAGMRHYFADDHMHIVEGVFTDKLAVVRKLFGEDCTGEDMLWIDDKPTETAQALRAFPRMQAFVRFESRDERFSESDMQKLREEFGDRVSWSTTLRVVTTQLCETYDT